MWSVNSFKKQWKNKFQACWLDMREMGVVTCILFTFFKGVKLWIKMCQANIGRKISFQLICRHLKEEIQRAHLEFTGGVELKELWVHGNLFKGSNYLHFQSKSLAALSKPVVVIPRGVTGTLIKMEFLHVRKRTWIEISRNSWCLAETTSVT